MLELHILEVRLPLREGKPALVVVAPHRWPDAQPLAIAVPLTTARDDSVLSGELRDAGTSTASAAIHIQMEPVQALEAAVDLDLPLLGDPALFATDSAEPPRSMAFLQVCDAGPVS
jgi:hypothetical protein